MMYRPIAIPGCCRAVAVAIGLAALLAPPAAAQVSVTRSANGSVTIFRPLSIGGTGGLNFGRLHNQGPNAPVGTVTVTSAPPAARSSTGPGVQLLPGTNPEPVIRNLTGEPSRAYHVGLPASVTATPDGLLVDQFTVWSQNSGNISVSRLGTLNAAGQDTVRVGATLTVPPGTGNNVFTANVPVTLTYD